MQLLGKRKLIIQLISLVLCFNIIGIQTGNAEFIIYDFSIFKKHLVRNSKITLLPKTISAPLYKLTTEKLFNIESITKQKQKFEIIGPNLRSGSTYPDNLFLSQNAYGQTSTSTIGTTPSPFSIIVSMNISDARGRFAFKFKGSGGKISITSKKNSGTKYRIAKLVVTPPDGSINTFILELGSKGKFLLEFQCDANVYFGGIYFLDNKSSITMPESIKKPRVAIVGDSFSEPTISDTEVSYSWQGFPQIFAQITGTNVYSFAAGGTGYVKQFQNRASGLERFRTEVLPAKFDVVIIALGINDLRSSYGADLNMVLQDMLAFSKLQSPNTLVFVVSPFWPNGIMYAPQSLSETNDMLNVTCVEYINCRFINLWSDNGYIQGSGNMLEPKNDGNADWITGPDGTHPTIRGHEYIARYILNKMLTSI